MLLKQYTVGVVVLDIVSGIVSLSHVLHFEVVQLLLQSERN